MSTVAAPGAALGSARQVSADVLNAGCHELGPSDGPRYSYYNGFPYDVHSYVEVVPLLAARGHRVIVPHLRGRGSTRFLSEATPRFGEQASLGADTVALMDPVHIDRAVLADYDWGGRAACIVAALWPERCAGLVSVNKYQIQDIRRARNSAPHIPNGVHGTSGTLRANAAVRDSPPTGGIARQQWASNSPTWHFDDAFERSPASLHDPGYVSVVIHSYRHRLGPAAGYPKCAGLEAKFALSPVSGKRIYRQVSGAGHNLPQAAPQMFVDAVTGVARL